MKYLYKLVYLLICLSAFCNAQNNNALLWEISGNGLNKPSWLFGTMHTSSGKFFNLPDSVFMAIESAENFAGEINMDSIQYVAVKLMEGSNNPELDVSKILSKEEFEQLNKKFKEKLGVGLESIPIKNPVIISFMFEKDLFTGDMPCSLDEYMYRIAKARGKKILGVEYIDEQVNIINNISVKDAREMLLNSISDKAKDDSADAAKLFEAYFNEDLDKINELASTAMGKGSELDAKFLVDRNLKMVEKINQFVKEKPIFIAVGAAHLPGEKGLLKLLKEKGYSLRPVKSNKSVLSDKYKGEILK